MVTQSVCMPMIFNTVQITFVKNSKRVWHQPTLHILRLPIFANFDL